MEETTAQSKERLLKALKFFKHLKSTNTKVYISGPISGYVDLNAPAFEDMERTIKLNDLVPINPLKIVDLKQFKVPLTPSQEWVYCMKADIRELMGCSAVFTLDGWRKSMGATWEVLNAKMLSIPVLDDKFNFIYLSPVDLYELYQKITVFMVKNDQEIRELHG